MISEWRLPNIINNQLIETKGKPFIKSLISHLDTIERHDNFPEKYDYLLKLLADMGCLRMIGIEIPKDMQERIEAVFKGHSAEGVNKSNPEPTGIHFDYLEDCLSYYLNSFNDIQGEKPPVWTEDLENEHCWMEKWEDLKDDGYDLILKGIDITATLIGYDYATKFLFFPEAFSFHFKLFKEQGEKFLSKIKQHAKKFQPISKDAFALLEEYFYMPECPMKDFLNNVSKKTGDYGRIRFYCNIVPAWRIREIDRYHEEGVRFLFSTDFKTRLLTDMLSTFINNKCHGLMARTEIREKTRVKDWKLSSSLDTECLVSTHVLYANQKNYSLHMGDTLSMGWEIKNSKDLFLKFIKNDSSYGGAVFGSVKYYPSDAALVRFDSFLPKNKVIDLLKKNSGADICLDHHNIWTPGEIDPREIFLEEAALAVMGCLETQMKSIIQTTGEMERPWIENIPNVLKNIYSAPGRALDSGHGFFKDVMNRCADAIRQSMIVMKPEARSMGGDKPARSVFNIEENQRIYYIHMDAFENIAFLDPEDSNVSDLVTKAALNRWECIWFFMDSNNKLVDSVKGPKDITGIDPVEDTAPENAEFACFFLKPKEMDKKGVQFSLIIYGPPQKP